MQNRSSLNNSPLNKYQTLVSSKQINFDDSQQQAVELLQQLYLSLQPKNITQACIKPNSNKKIKGIYLWGKVGRGKTFLMDLFVHSLTESPSNQICKRQHFHHFMRDVHYQLNELSGKPDPLKIIAERFSQQYRVLCFDEFFVSDIGDAMLLGNLLQYLFELKIVIVSTSNCSPDNLFRNGLQRERFLPAIAAIEKHTHILPLAGEYDHRHRILTYVQNYFVLPSPVDQQAFNQQTNLHQSLLNRFKLTFSEIVNDKLNTPSCNEINILGRPIRYIAKNVAEDEQTISFEFSALCQGPRSHFDYVELAKQFNTLILFNVPPMSGHAYERIKARGTEDNGSNINVSAKETGEREVVLAPMDDAVRRFIALVDECYDCQLNLVITAYVPLNQLYNHGALMFEFERTKSRLTEMASMEYLDKKYNKTRPCD
jgi:cell division protein ZapE